MKFQGRLLASALGLILVQSHQVNAERIFEFGVGGFAFSVPEYAGAKETKNYLVPLPYFYYQDDNIKVDREGLISSLWQLDNWYLDFSASAHIPVKSEDVAIRQGMPDIDWALQLGPALKYYFQGTENSTNKTLIEFYTRKAIVTDFSYVADAGWQYGASFTTQSVVPKLLDGKLKWQNRVSINFASDRYQQLYYGIDSEYQTENRIAYQADGGYLSSTVSTGLTYRFGQWWVAGFLLYRNMEDTVNERSAILQKTENIAAGFGVAWIFKQ